MKLCSTGAPRAALCLSRAIVLLLSLAPALGFGELLVVLEQARPVGADQRRDRVADRVPDVVMRVDDVGEDVTRALVNLVAVVAGFVGRVRAPRVNDDLLILP